MTHNNLNQTNMLDSTISIYTLEKPYNYTYWITNIKEEKHYIGVRSCIIHPTQDLGIKYFGSKHKNGKIDKEFISYQKEHPEDWEYKILKLFKTRKEASFHEIELHEEYDVGKNLNFYNNTKAISIGFNNNGLIMSLDSRNKMSKSRSGEKHYLYGKELSEETKRKISVTKTGVPRLEETKRKISNSQLGEDNNMFGKKHSEESKKKMSRPRGSYKKVEK
jgi:hypothetical protein